MGGRSSPHRASRAGPSSGADRHPRRRRGRRTPARRAGPAWARAGRWRRARPVLAWQGVRRRARPVLARRGGRRRAAAAPAGVSTGAFGAEPGAGLAVVAGPGAAPTGCRPRPKLMGPLPRGRCCPVREVRAVRRRGGGRSGTGGRESRAARPAIPRLGRAQRLGRRLRRQRRGPGSVRLPAGRPGNATPGRSLAVSGCAIWAGAGRRRLRCWLGCLQEPSRGGCHAGPGIVVSGWLAAGLLVRGGLHGGHCGGLRGRPGFLGIIGLRLARARNHQAWRHGPGRHEIVRVIPAEQACTLLFFLRRGIWMTILTRLVALCIHHRPQSRHIYGKCRSVPILTLSRLYGLARGLMLPIESKRVQRAIFGLCRTNAAVPRTGRTQA